MKYQYEPIGDEYKFQTFLKDLFNAIYETSSFEEYGTKGQIQYGVDIYSPELKIAIQAKKKDINRNSRTIISELLSDLTKTNSDLDRFPHPVDHLYFATTTTKHIQVQDACIEASLSGNRKLQFFCWIDIQEEITKFSSIRNKYFPYLKDNKIENDNIDIVRRLHEIEKLLSQHMVNNSNGKKQYRTLPNCAILLPDVEIEYLKFLIGTILKIALYRVFSNTKYLEFTCLFNYSNSYTCYEDGSSSSGFDIISGQVTFLGECNRLVKTFQHNSEKFWQIIEEYEANDSYKNIKLLMTFLPNEGLTAYKFKIDGQTGSYEIKPQFFEKLDYDNLANFSDVLPFIASTTELAFHVLDFDQIAKYPAFMKFVYNALIDDSFKVQLLKVNVNDFEDWDYDYKIRKNDD